MDLYHWPRPPAAHLYFGVYFMANNRRRLITNAVSLLVGGER